MEKSEKLVRLEEEILKNTSLPLVNTRLVFGEGNPDAKVVFIGEAPGFYEDREGRPFVGRSGKLLDKLIEGIGWKRENVYITNIVKRRPPENRDPMPEEIEAYSPYLVRQIEIIEPKVIAPLGRFAMNHFLPDAKISRDNGNIFNFGEGLLVPLYHPAAALRSTTVNGDLRRAFLRLKDAVDGSDNIKAQSESPKNHDGENLSSQQNLFN